MKATLHFEHGDFCDSIVIEGDSLEELREQADRLVRERKPDHYWSSDAEAAKPTPNGTAGEVKRK